MNNDDVLIVYSKLKEMSDKTETPDAGVMVVLVTLLIKIVEKIAGDKSGTYKKELVIKVLTKVVEDSKISDDSKSSLIAVINYTIPTMIDTMISLAKNEINIGKMKEQKRSCLELCF